jgi:hypothetical protein
MMNDTECQRHGWRSTNPDKHCPHCKTEDAKIDALERALEESVKLQSHYAGLLNSYDGGTRLQFENAAHWLKRLKETA